MRREDEMREETERRERGERKRKTGYDNIPYNMGSWAWMGKEEEGDITVKTGKIYAK